MKANYIRVFKDAKHSYFPLNICPRVLSCGGFKYLDCVLYNELTTSEK